jgi:hypothetical protein
MITELESLNIEKTKRRQALEAAQSALDQIEQRDPVYIWLRGFFGVVGRFIWNSRQILFGFLLALFFVQICSINFTSIVIPNPNPIHKNQKKEKDKSRVLTVKEIAAGVPSDSRQRRLFVEGITALSDEIDSGNIADKSDAYVFLKTNIGGLIANKDWYSTTDAIDAMIESSDLHDLSEKLKELSGLVEEK